MTVRAARKYRSVGDGHDRAHRFGSAYQFEHQMGRVGASDSERGAQAVTVGDPVNARQGPVHPVRG
ncbi:hypothetical protein [Spirillospora sp. NPDC047279]|uniref:hypothetical protein n=1 Tax=Spirillospora sp. NPDC047279 TaxID=3155478 RepID=UPI0033D9EBD8